MIHKLFYNLKILLNIILTTETPHFYFLTVSVYDWGQHKESKAADLRGLSEHLWRLAEAAGSCAHPRIWLSLRSAGPQRCIQTVTSSQYHFAAFASCSAPTPGLVRARGIKGRKHTTQATNRLREARQDLREVGLWDNVAAEWQERNVLLWDVDKAWDINSWSILWQT